MGLEVTARNLKGVTIKDALDAIHKQFKKRVSTYNPVSAQAQTCICLTRDAQADDELDLPYLKGFEWDKEESWTRLIVHLRKDAGQPVTSSKKKNKKGGDE